LKAEHARGRRLILVSASKEKFVEAIAKYLGIFDRALVSTATLNLAGNEKLKRIKNLLGDSSFNNAGNAMADFAL